jgi:hypothetical protein
LGAGTVAGEPASGTAFWSLASAYTLTWLPAASWWWMAKRHGPPSGSTWSALASLQSAPSTSTRSRIGPVTSSPQTRPQMVVSVTLSMLPSGIPAPAERDHPAPILQGEDR